MGWDGRGSLGRWTRWNRRHHLGCRAWGRAVSYTGDHGSDCWSDAFFLMRKEKKCKAGYTCRASRTSGTKSSKLGLCVALHHPLPLSPLLTPLGYLLFQLIFISHSRCQLLEGTNLVLAVTGISRSYERIQQIPVNGSSTHPLPVLWMQKLKPRERTSDRQVTQHPDS